MPKMIFNRPHYMHLLRIGLFLATMYLIARYLHVQYLLACHHVLADTLSLIISFTHQKNMAICSYSRAWIGQRDGSSLERQFRRRITGLRSRAAVYDLTGQGVVFLPSPRGDADGRYRFRMADVGVFAKGGKFLYWALLGLVSCGSRSWRISAPSAKLGELG